MTVSIVDLSNGNSSGTSLLAGATTEDRHFSQNVDSQKLQAESGLLQGKLSTLKHASFSSHLNKVQAQSNLNSLNLGNQLPVFENSELEDDVDGVEFVDLVADIDLSVLKTVPSGDNTQQLTQNFTVTINPKTLSRKTPLLVEVNQPVLTKPDSFIGVEGATLGAPKQENNFIVAPLEMRLKAGENSMKETTFSLDKSGEKISDNSLIPKGPKVESSLKVDQTPLNNLATKNDLGTTTTKPDFFEQLKDAGLLRDGLNSSTTTSTRTKELDLDLPLMSKIELKSNLSKLASISSSSLQQVQSLLASNKDKLQAFVNSSTSAKSDLQPVISATVAVQNLSSLAGANIDQSNIHLMQQGLMLRNDFSPNLANRIQWMYQQALSSAEILMDPPELGPLSVKLKTHHGETSVLFQVNNLQTKDMIEDNLAKLREMLEQQGMQLGDAQVEHREKDQSNGEGSANDSSSASEEIEIKQGSSHIAQSINILDTYV